MPGYPTQVEALRRGLSLAALLWSEPRRVADLAGDLDLAPRDIQRLMAGLREAEIEITTEVRGRERYHNAPGPSSSGVPWREGGVDP